MKYAIGLDCGITSVGYAVMELNEEETPKRIIRLGSRIFSAAENPKDGSSLALPRRDARSARRRLRRHRHRLERIRRLIVEEKILTQKELDELYVYPVSDIYELRRKALDASVSKEEFARILIHLAQRRGFKSNRKVDKESDDNGKLLSAVNVNKKLMEEKGYRTVGEMFACDEKFQFHKRNKSESYLNTVARELVEEEAHKIFEAQRMFGNAFASEKIENSYVAILCSQRSFDEGPGGDSEYGGNQIEKMIGRCTFYPDELRAAKATYHFQYFELLQAVNHMRLTVNGTPASLTPEQRKIVIAESFKNASISYDRLRKLLNLPDNVTFSDVRYGSESREECEKKKKFAHMKSYNEMRKKFDKLKKGHIRNVSCDDLDEIGYALTVFKTDDKVCKYLGEHTQLTKEELSAVLEMPSFSKFGHISVKACKQIIPGLEKGEKYNEACEEAGLDFRAHNHNTKQKFLPSNSAEAPELGDITNPVVRRAVSQTIKVINAIIREMGESPTYLNIELAREVVKSFSERKDIQSNYEKNRANNEKLKKEITENFGISNPSGLDIVKMKLWHEQDGISPYSQKSIHYEKLFDSGYAEVDHIIPYSISFDDSYTNKILVFSDENRTKGNRLPLEYLSGKDRDSFTVWVQNNIKNYKKRQHLLKKKVTEEDQETFKERNLNDTKYLNRFLLNFIQDHLLFAESELDKKKKVRSVNGSVTAYMRKRWGIAKIRENGDLHHAADAAVIACVNDSMINRITKWSKLHENIIYQGQLLVDSETGELLDRFPLPYPEFRKELDLRLGRNEDYMRYALSSLPNYRGVDLEQIHSSFVSRMPTHKTTGAAHLDTVRSPKRQEDGIVIAKTPLCKLKLKNGEIENYYNPESDLLLYNALKEKLERAGGQGDKAFPAGTDFHKPKRDGTEGPVVRTVKTYKKSTMNVALNGGAGVADNSSMIRIDVFYVKGEGYYFVPIYVADKVKKRLPNKASVPSKAYVDWKEMADEDFLFSLYPNDLIRVEKKTGDIKLKTKFKDSALPNEEKRRRAFLYFVSADISTASISLINHDNSYLARGLGIKGLASIEKYQVDVLGNYHRVGKEKRQAFRKT